MSENFLVFLVIAAMIGFAALIMYLIKRVRSIHSHAAADDKVTSSIAREPEKKPEKKSGNQTYDSIFTHKTAEKKVICPYCDAENWPQAKYCDVCGEPM